MFLTVFYGSHMKDKTKGKEVLKLLISIQIIFLNPTLRVYI